MNEIKKQNQSGLIGLSKIFARARKEMTLSEYKAFFLALTKIRWSDDCPTTIDIPKKELAEVLNIKSDINHLSGNIWRSIKNLPKHSAIEIALRDQGIYQSGVMITDITKDQRDVYRITFNPNYVGLFGRLDCDYITLYSADLFTFKSDKSVTMYEYLRLNSDTRKTNTKIFSTKELKELLSLPIEAYMRHQGGFDRLNFERYVINPICEDLAGCKMIKLKKHGNEYYKKILNGGRVVGYEFKWNVTPTPNVADADEYHDIVTDPATVKIAIDIKKGEKKQPKKANMMQFTNQNEYDFAALEKQLLSH